MILFLDTETSGFPKNGVGLEDPTQARILEIACILTDDQGKVISTLDTLVQCGDIELSDKLPHDIAVKDCNEKGITYDDLRHFLISYAVVIDKIVAHNIEFDLKMIALHTDIFKFV
jgi:DNA polymerase III epsilon subunit-like protein